MVPIRMAFYSLVIASAVIIGAGLDHQWTHAKDPANPANCSERLRDELEAPRPNDPGVVYGIHPIPHLFRLEPERLVDCGQDWACFEGQNDPPYVRDALPHECNSPWGCFVDTDNRIVPRAPNDDEWIVCTTDLDCLQKHGHGMILDDDEEDGGDES